MTNLQLMLVIGIPSLLIIISSFKETRRMDRIARPTGKPLNNTAERLDGREEHLDGHEKRVDNRRERLDEPRERLYACDQSLNDPDWHRDDRDRHFKQLLAANHEVALEIVRSANRVQERLAIIEARQRRS